ncbi:transmembrane amino acid transporter protein-domain-containing protein [Chaetomium strumarium]|uniref:Transmembrane amino acid transporter protein-domain-containing protein n=1 Tax=Chaetomium strumarium TaxID=1170767 RepID=A0AAJ0M0K8_9PEZI|nr:transmembrane amino acid transporter protein-domain-containing protein [Chaetomium strumarium]
MARATSHGAAAAAHPRQSNHRRHGAASSPSGRNNNNDDNSHSEEGVGLLAAGPDAADDDNDDDDGDDALIVHPGDDSDGHHAPRTPRTPNRVRFDLRPTMIDDGNRRSDGSASEQADDHDPYPRESFDFDDLDASDPLSSSSSSSSSLHTRHQHRQQQQQRVPLLTGIEAPSVTVATTPSSPFHSHEDAETWAAAERARPKSSLPSAFMNMANSIIGAGIIGQPYAFRQAGLLSGVALLVALTFVVDWTIRLIVVNSKLSGASSFQGTVEKCFGRTGLVAISVAQWAFAFGGMVAFGVIVGDSIPSVLRAVWPGLREMPVLGLLADRRVVIVVFTLGVSYPLTLYRDIAKLAKASTLALVSMVVIVVTVVVQGLMVPAEARGSLKDWRLLVINDGIFQAIAVISFAFVCHHNSLLIYGSLEKPTIDRFAKVTHYSTAVSMFACLFMALAGFLTFGDKTQGNVLNNFPPDNTMVNVARLCFGLNMLTTLPLEAFVCREVMLNYYFPGEPFNMNLHLIFSSSLVFTAMVLSLVTCDLGTVFDLVGGTSAAAMAYILPPLCYIKLTTRSWKTYLAWAVVAFGCTVMLMSMLQATEKMIKGEGGTRQCY